MLQDCFNFNINTVNINDFIILTVLSMDISANSPYIELNETTRLPLKDDVVDVVRCQNKASWSKYIFYSSLLILMSPLTTLATVSLFAASYFNRKNPEYITAHNQIRSYLNHKDRFHKQNTYVTSVTERILNLTSAHLRPILLDVLSLDENLSHISHILQGANVKIEGDKGVFFDKWKVIHGTHVRKSSHPCDKDGTYSLRGDFFHEFLFWKDPVTHCTRFQLEKSSFQPFTNPVTSILHARDYLNYKRLNLQQGPFGASPVTDNNPICIHHHQAAFECNKQKLQDLLPPSQ